jgi:hypothetical protein
VFHRWYRIAAWSAVLGLVLALAWRPVGARPHALVASGGVQSDIPLEQLLARYFAATDEYEQAFRNLVAEETKTIEVYRASGEIEKRREIVSELLVYRSTRPGTDATVEYRDVRSVDGKAVKQRGERALKLLMNAARAGSLDKELEAIDRETSKYEFHRNVRGMSIYQRDLPKAWLAAFQVDQVGREQIAGRDVAVIDFRQTTVVPALASSLLLPREFGNPPELVRGRLWLDAETGQPWRIVWELVVRHPASPDPLAIVRRESTYVRSRLGPLVPERIVFDWLMRFSHPKNGPPSFGLSERTTFSYGAFRRFDVATSEEVKPPGTPRP